MKAPDTEGHVLSLYSREGPSPGTPRRALGQRVPSGQWGVGVQQTRRLPETGDWHVSVLHAVELYT